MENVFKMSLFMPPISPIKDKTTGRTVKSATLTPLRTINLEEIYKLITSNEKLTALTLEVRNAALQGDTALRDPLRNLHPSPKRLPGRAVRTGSSRHRSSRIHRRSRNPTTRIIR